MKRFFLFFSFFLFFVIDFGFSTDVLIWTDGVHMGHIYEISNILKEENLSFEIYNNTTPPDLKLLEKHKILILEYDFFRNPTFNDTPNTIRRFLGKDKAFIGINDGGVRTFARILNTSVQTDIYCGSLKSILLYNKTILREYPIGSHINLGYSSCYNIAYFKNENYTSLKLFMKLLTKNYYFGAIKENKPYMFSLSIGCGGSINKNLCNEIYKDVIKWYKLKALDINVTSIKPFVRYIKFDITKPKLFIIKRFGIEINGQIYDVINLSCNESQCSFFIDKSDIIGNLKIKIIVIVDNNTINLYRTFFYLPYFYNKMKILFVVDQNLTNILSLSYLKKPIIITNQITPQILYAISKYKPDQIFLLGNIKFNLSSLPRETHIISSYKDVPKIFNRSCSIFINTTKNFSHKIFSVKIATLLNCSITFNKTESTLDFFINSTEDLEKLYFDLIKLKGRNINHLIISTKNEFLPIYFISKHSYPLILNSSENHSTIKNQIMRAIDKLNRKGFFINNSRYITDKAFITIIGDIPFIKKEDPVEKSKILGLINFEDPKDGKYFFSDLEYGDINEDNYLDIPVGRFPSNSTKSSLMFFYSSLEFPKKALVASEYLHSNWLSILLYFGGGMLQGKTISSILEKQGYEVDRLVEYRAKDISEFLMQFSPDSIQDFLDTVKTIEEKIKKLVGKTIANVVSKSLIVFKGLNFIEQGLEMYLEYDWSTFGLKKGRLYDLVYDLISQNENTISFETATRIVEIFWPYKYDELTRENLINHIPNKEIVYYEGIGNNSSWILPNEFPSDTGFLGWREFFMNRYNGSSYFSSKDMPISILKIVWDNNDISVFSNIRESFLDKSASFIGSSAINYAPFSSEIDSRFFKEGNIIGYSLINAINNFYENSFTWDPFNIIKPGIKSKSLREFVLFGDPSLHKDPIIEPKIQPNITCENICEISVKIPINYTILKTKNQTTVIFNSTDFLVNEFESIIPLKTVEFYIPNNSDLISNNTKISYIFLRNITLPHFDLLSHSNFNISRKHTDKIYPKLNYSLRIFNLVDGRKKLKLIVPLLIYNKTSGDAYLVTSIFFNFSYRPQLDFLVNSTFDDRRVNLHFYIWSNFTNKNIAIFSEVQFSNTTFFVQENATITNFTKLTIPFNVPYFGNYKIDNYIVYDDPIIVGPRTIYLNIKKKIPIKKEEKKEVLVFSEKFIPPNTTRIVTNHTIEKETSLCGDNVCGPDEDFKSCPSDCLIEPKNISFNKITKRKLPTSFFFLQNQTLLIVLFTIITIIVIAWIFR